MEHHPVKGIAENYQQEHHLVKEIAELKGNKGTIILSEMFEHGGVSGIDVRAFFIMGICYNWDADDCWEPTGIGTRKGFIV